MIMISRKPFIRCNRGTTTPEYAILLLLILVAAIPAVGSFGQLVENTVEDVGPGLDGTSASTSTPTPHTDQEPTLAATSDNFSSWRFWGNAISFLAIAMTVAWLIFRNKSSQDAATPRPLAINEPDNTSDRAVQQRQHIARRLYNVTDSLLMGDVMVRHVMTDHPVTVGPQATGQQASEIMKKQHLEYLLVCDEDEKFLGLVSHYYLPLGSAKRVADVMLPDALFVAPDAMLSPTISQMLNKGVSCLAVIEDDRVVGIVTTRDVQLTLQAALQVLARATGEEQFVEPEPAVIA